jgi:hypothetical protein
MGSTVTLVQRVAVIGWGGLGQDDAGQRASGAPGDPGDPHRLSLRKVHGGQRVEATPKEWAGCHHGLVAGQAWVIDGMKLGDLRERLARADTVVFWTRRPARA